MGVPRKHFLHLLIYKALFFSKLKYILFSSLCFSLRYMKQNTLTSPKARLPAHIVLVGQEHGDMGREEGMDVQKLTYLKCVTG